MPAPVPTPLVIAHRGDSAHRPENTLAAFASALEIGAAIAEFDVHLTRDGEVVVIHDATLDRTTNGHGAVRNLTLAEIRRFSAGYPARFGSAYPGERVPTLGEVLGLLRERAQAMIEIKAEAVTDDAEGGIEAHVVEEVRKARMEKDVALISFDRRALMRCRTFAPEILRGHLFERGKPGDMLAGAREVASELVMPEKRLLSDELRDRAREAGVKVATWVVDDIEELRRLMRFELYGVGSNRPGEMLEALESL
ncbi:MAG TPA: glycerophosphodiester phosphodiesterase family protein [Vicinamibacteria bacterium]|nr:glycerophosphodiester phosphodiesterase family protein [Vicinamibacteria bacterium]